MGLTKEGYWSSRDIMGYNAIINIVLSGRGRGKTYEGKRFLMSQPGLFMCLYRQQPDMAHAMSSWLDTLFEAGYTPDQFEWRGNDKDGWSLYFEEELKAYFRYLTQVNNIKQEVFPDNLDWIFIDEFIPLKYTKLAGIESEGDAIRTIMKTIDHDSVHSREEKGLNPLRVLMFANPFTWNNPILSYFHVIPRFGIHRCGPGIVCEYLPPIEKDDALSTIERMNEFLGDEVNQNSGWIEERAFISPIPKGSTPRISIRLDTGYFWIYFDNAGKQYIKRAKAHHSGKGIPLFGVFKGLQECEYCLDDSRRFVNIQSGCYSGCYWYESINTKFDFIKGIALVG